MAIKPNIITIDAEGKRLGRVASEAARHLLGKTAPAFSKNVVADVAVNIVNASKLSLSEQKLTNTTYIRYSGYPGGLKTETLKHLAARSGYGEALRRAVEGMLPHNKLQKQRMKHLTISE